MPVFGYYNHFYKKLLKNQTWAKDIGIDFFILKISIFSQFSYKNVYLKKEKNTRPIQNA